MASPGLLVTIQATITHNWYRLAVYWGMEEEEAWLLCNPLIERGEN